MINLKQSELTAVGYGSQKRTRVCEQQFPFATKIRPSRVRVANAVKHSDDADQMPKHQIVNRQAENSAVGERSSVQLQGCVDEQRSAVAEIARAILHILAEHDGVCPGLTHRDGFECRHNDFVPRYVAAPGTTPDVSEARRNTEPARKSSLTGSELRSAQLSPVADCGGIIDQQFESVHLLGLFLDLCCLAISQDSANLAQRPRDASSSESSRFKASRTPMPSARCSKYSTG